MIINTAKISLLFAQLIFALGWVWPENSHGIVVTPTDQEIQEALRKGEEAAKAKIPPNQLYWRFGPQDEFIPHGFLMTKLTGLTVFSTHFALRSTRPSEREIEQFLTALDLKVSVTVFGASPTFAIDSYIVLKQRDRLIKSRRVRADARASRSSKWPDHPAYRAKIIASFPYGSFDPTSATAISVFPGEGGEDERNFRRDYLYRIRAPHGRPHRNQFTLSG